jgi:hypothetical protein
MGGVNFRDGYEFDPETYDGEGGGLPGMLRRFMQQSQQQGADFGLTPNGGPEYGPETAFSPQGGLLGRLLSLHAEQSRYQPISENGGQAPFFATRPELQAARAGTERHSAADAGLSCATG